MRRTHLLPATACAATLALAALLPAAAGAADTTVRRLPRTARTEVRVIPSGERGMFFDAARRGYLGVHVVELTPELRRHFQAGEDAGVLVSKVEEDSPAAAAGVAVGDVLVAVDGDEVASSWDLRRVVAPHEDGDTVALEVVRGGRELELSARLQERQGRVLELGQLLQRDDEGRHLLVLPSEHEWEAFGEHFEDLGEEISEAMEEAFDDPDVRLRIGRELRQREQLERQIDVLERRLQDLERRLEEQRR